MVVTANEIMDSTTSAKATGVRNNPVNTVSGKKIRASDKQAKETATAKCISEEGGGPMSQLITLALSFVISQRLVARADLHVSCTGSPNRELATILVQCHGRRGCNIIAERLAVDRNFHDIIKKLHHLVHNSQSFVTNHQNSSPLEWKVMETH